MFVRRDMTKTVAMQTRLRWLNILVGAAGILLAVALVFVLIRTQVVTPSSAWWRWPTAWRAAT